MVSPESTRFAIKAHFNLTALFAVRRSPFATPQTRSTLFRKSLTRCHLRRVLLNKACNIFFIRNLSHRWSLPRYTLGNDIREIVCSKGKAVEIHGHGGARCILVDWSQDLMIRYGKPCSVIPGSSRSFTPSNACNRMTHFEYGHGFLVLLEGICCKNHIDESGGPG